MSKLLSRIYNYLAGHYTEEVSHKIDDLENTDRFESIFNAFLKSEDIFRIIDEDTIKSGQIVVDTSSNSMSNIKSNLITDFGDSVQWYLRATSIFSNTTDNNPYFLSICQPHKNSLSSQSIHIGNVNTNSWRELKIFFKNLGYDMNHVSLNTKTDSRFLYKSAIVCCRTLDIANKLIYDFSVHPHKFVFNSIPLKIQYAKTKPKTIQLINHFGGISQSISNKSIEIENIRELKYGTLLTPLATRNIFQRTNGRMSLGLLAQDLKPSSSNVNVKFEIDQEKRKFSFTLSAQCLDDSNIRSEVKFEWSFQDLYGEKMRPILVGNSSIYFMIQLKRSPIITRSSTTAVSRSNQGTETRQPASIFLAHANAWLFPMPFNNRETIIKLFTYLRKHNLSNWDVTGSSYNVISLFNSPNYMPEYIEQIELLSNDKWVKENTSEIESFLENRWLKIPFEKKFEVMKLISKRIATVQDLISDVHFDFIVSKCSVNALVACLIEITGNASYWLQTTYDSDFDSPDDNVKDIPLPVYMDSIASSAEELYDVQQQPMTSILRLTKKHLGFISRLLLLVLDKMNSKGQLYLTSKSRILVTKNEIKTENTGLFLMHKIYVTPSTILHERPDEEEKCAVTRKFEKYQNQFLRVVFRDEDYRKLQDYGGNMTDIYKRIKNILINGINICDRHYEFVAFSSSQLREHSCWMFAKLNNNVSAETIRTWMGNFDDIRPVAKLAARLGQSFSTSIKGVELQRKQFQEIDDIMINDHNFTDGIGIIAPWLAKILTKKNRNGQETSCPSAFQIRFSGFKGMVCLDVANKITNPEIGLYFRKSMNKFESTNYSIDVVRFSSPPTSSTLNRQIILLLSSLGIDEKIFLSIQRQMLGNIRDLTRREENICRALRELNETDSNSWNKFLIAYIKKFENRQDPFVRYLLQIYQTFLVKELRMKSRIVVKNSWNLLGVCDETRTLQYGQVFVQIVRNDRSDYSCEILKGPVIVTRNPCFHPGDIRRLEAVDIPALHSLKNVIVFPVNGPRPHQFEMSGGDLDGDTFWISNEQKLIFETNEDPFDYRDQEIEALKATQMSENKKYTIKDICEFFVEYIEADNLGIIANTHMAIADTAINGCKSEKCLKLARMHSVAVDFAKTGINAPRLASDQRPQSYPHYMEKRDKPSYRSENVIGKLYDEVMNYKIEQNDDIAVVIQETSSFPYEELCGYAEDTYVIDARDIKESYDREIRRLMHQYGVRSEAEIITGCILQFTTQQYAKEKQISELKRQIKYAITAIQNKYICLFWKEFYKFANHNEENKRTPWIKLSKTLNWENQLKHYKFHTTIEDLTGVFKKASSWFLVTYESWMELIEQHRKHNTAQMENIRKKQSTFRPIFSFAWLIYPVLLEIFDKSNKPTNSRKRKAAVAFSEP